MRVAEPVVTQSVDKMANRNIPIYDETAGSKLARKAKESPFMIAGIVGLVASCVVGAYKFKHKGAMSTSVYLTQLRVTAQGITVGCLTVGLAISMINEYILGKKPE